MGSRRDPDRQIISYLVLRMLIGLVGGLLPLVIAIGQLATGGWANLSPSISASYYTGFRDFLVGTLWVLGFFLLSYRGKKTAESITANISCFFAVGVAMLPCCSPSALVRGLHLASAAGLLTSFGMFSLWHFRKGLKTRLQERHIRNINRVYIVCGTLIFTVLAGLLVVMIFVSDSFREKSKIVFLLESAALWAFAYSWLTRAHILWRNRKEYPRRFPELRP